jgi:hypothetical protein
MHQMQMMKAFHARRVVLSDFTFDNIVLVRLGGGTKGWTLLDYGNSPNDKVSNANLEQGSSEAQTSTPLKSSYPVRQASPEVRKTTPLRQSTFAYTKPLHMSQRTKYFMCSQRHHKPLVEHAVGGLYHVSGPR